MPNYHLLHIFDSGSFTAFICEMGITMRLERMIQKENLNIFVGNLGAPDTSDIASQKNNGQVKNGTIYAGNRDSSSNNTIAMKKQKAQKQALKTVMDTFSAEDRVDEDIRSRKRHQEELTDQIMTSQKEIENLQTMRQDLKDSYGITDDSEEQKNLELLEKSISSPENMTEEEIEKLNNIGSLTDYQKEALKYDAMEQVWQQRITDGKNGIVSENMTINSIHLERLKSHPMVDAQKAAAEIIEQASKDIIAQLKNEARENIDEKLEENQEKAEDAAKEKKEEEEKIEKKKKEEDPSAQLMKAVTAQEKIEKDLQKIIEKNQLLAEDLKGITINSLV